MKGNFGRLSRLVASLFARLVIAKLNETSLNDNFVKLIRQRSGALVLRRDCTRQNQQVSKKCQNEAAF